MILAGQELANPRAPRTIGHGFTLAVFELGIHAAFKEHLNDFPLRLNRRRLATAASASVLDGEVKRRAPRLVFHCWISPGCEQELHSSGTPSTNCPVQRGRAIHVLQMDVGPVLQQAL